MQAATAILLGQATTGADSVKVESVWDFLIKGGPLMIPIGLCSLIALAVFVERLVSLRRGRIIPSDFLPGLKALLRNGDEDRAKALKSCRDNGSPIANIVAAGIKRLDEPVERMEKNIDEAGQREVMGLRRNLRVLSVIAAVAPLLGLLGTIFGMIEAFQTVATSGEALGKTELLAKGIYEAMITTAAGLSLAIPVLVFYHVVSAQIDRIVTEMDRMTVDFMEEFASPPRRQTTLTAVAEAEEVAALPLRSAAGSS